MGAEDVMGGGVREQRKQVSTPGGSVARATMCWGGRQHCRGQWSASNLALRFQANTLS